MRPTTLLLPSNTQRAVMFERCKSQIPRLLLVSVALGLTLPSQAWSGQPHDRALPNSLSVSRELERLDAQGARADSQLRSVDQSAKQFGDGIKLARRTAALLRDFEKRLKRISDRLTPYQSLPHIRTAARYLKKSIDRVHAQIIKVRRKSDDAERRFLIPAQRKVSQLRRSIYTARTKLSTVRREIANGRDGLHQAMSVARRDVHLTYALESTARRCRPVVSRLVAEINAVGNETDRIIRSIRKFDELLSAYATVGNSIQQSGDKMHASEKVVGNIDKVISKRIEIRNPINRKMIGFSVREILEKPQKIAKVLLKPFNRIVDKLLDPLLKKMKLEIPTPRGLSNLDAKLTEVGKLNSELQSQIHSLESGLSKALERALQSVQSQIREVQAAIVRQVTPAPRHSVRLSERDVVPPRDAKTAGRKGPVMFLSIE